MININYVGCTRPKTVASMLFSELCTPLSLDLLLDLQNNEWHEFFSKSDFHQENYDTARDVAIDLLAISFLKKSPNILSSDIDIKTLENFKSSEAKCLVSNEFHMSKSNLNSWNDFFQIFQSKIRQIMGPVPTRTLNFAFGPGVNIGRKGVDTSAYAKYCIYTPSVTSNAYPFAKLYLEHTLWGQYLLRGTDNKMMFDIQNASEVCFVPKNFKIKRTITIQPLMNTYFQKGIGSYLRERLKINGVDLRRQSTNQEAARRAQRDKLATVDLKSASDTICRVLVQHNCPSDWVSIMDAFRCHYASIDGQAFRLEQFSSMGNGFTFELETILFYAAAYAVVKMGSGKVTDISVYGDDVIIPSEDYPTFKETIEMLGFSINTEKTFVSGRFFESCGMDFFDGINVRPFYLKTELIDRYDIYQCHNALLAFSERWKVDLSGTINLLKGMVPVGHRHYVPFPYAGGFWASCASDLGITSDGWEGSVHKCLIFKPAKVENENFEPAVLHALFSPSNGRRTLRKCGKYVEKKLFFPTVTHLTEEERYRIESLNEDIYTVLTSNLSRE